MLLQFLMGSLVYGAEAWADRPKLGGPRATPPRKKIWPIFVAHCESYAQDIKTVVLEIRVLMSFFREKKCTTALCIFP